MSFVDHDWQFITYRARDPPGVGARVGCALKINSEEKAAQVLVTSASEFGSCRYDFPTFLVGAG